MNTEKSDNFDDETSRTPEESSSKNITTTTSPTNDEIEKTESQQRDNELFAQKNPSSLSLPLHINNQSDVISDDNERLREETVDDNEVVVIEIEEESEEIKRATAKKIIERYFYQLLEGCGNQNCENKNCASSGEVKNLTPNQAAAKAIQLYSQDEKFCDIHGEVKKQKDSERLNADGGGTYKTESSLMSPSSTTDATSHKQDDQTTTTPTTTRKTSEAIPKLTNKKTDSATATNINLLPQTSKSSQDKHTDSSPLGYGSDKSSLKVETIDEDEIMRLLEVCKADDCYSVLIRKLGAVFSSVKSLAGSFQKKPSASIDAILEKAPAGDLKSLKKEDLRVMEGDLDKDEDSTADESETPVVPHHITVNLVSLRRAMQQIYSDNCLLFDKINIAIQNLTSTISVDLLHCLTKEQVEEIINAFVIIFDVLNVGEAKVEFIEMTVPLICHAMSYLPIWAQARLAWIFSKHFRDDLQSLIEMLQQLITLQVIYSDQYHQQNVQNNEIIVNATKVLRIFYYANILAGVIEVRNRDDYTDVASGDSDVVTTASPKDDVNELFQYNNGQKNVKTLIIDDPLGLELNINVVDSRQPFIGFEHFYNDTLSETIEMDKDYLNYKKISTTNNTECFSFMLYSFILTPAIKTLSLYFDNRIRMYSERRINIFHTQMAGQPSSPYLKLKVRRDKLIDDALVELELIAMEVPKDLKKQLYVEFVGEEGVDEGGVSKEFFHLIVDEIFNPDYGMFIHNESTRTVWFNATSFENEAQFTLIGIVLGLAIYNNVILAVNFPMVVYRKLMGLKGTFMDLEDLNPVLFNSLKSMLDYQENDMEEVFVQTFKISYTDIFETVLYHELKPNGDSIFVNQDNKQEFVDLYSDFILNTSIEKQFLAFRRGFHMVTDESPLQLLFRPEEIELLVCGSKDFDFKELEEATEYEGDYTSECQTIIDFWTIVHAWPIEFKRKLLEFTTGSDRVPVGGLSRLKMVIVRNGPDSDRLPTSHTCFNVLLLPEYETKEKLEERLLKAINYSKGFGMI